MCPLLNPTQWSRLLSIPRWLCYSCSLFVVATLHVSMGLVLDPYGVVYSVRSSLVIISLRNGVLVAVKLF